MLQSLKQRFVRRDTKAPATVPSGISDSDFRQLSFTFAVIALSARVACLDGELTPVKYAVFRESFPLGGGICGKIRSLFALACEDSTPYTSYIMQIKYAFPERQDLFVSLLERLFRIAAAGGAVSPEAGQMLKSMGQLLGISNAEYTRISGVHNHVVKAQRVLGVNTQVTARKLKARYHELVQRYHPDRFSGDKLSQEVQLLLKLRTTEINEAYRVLRKQAA